MAAYYNENDPFAAAWLRELIKGGYIANGYVDERDIQDAQAGDLAGFAQCHFFAGIGGWSYALRLAGWPDDRPVWTGSCPCQPFSAAGKRQGTADSRHLWPHFYRLIKESGPITVFGEQVESKDGRAWLAAVQTDLEGSGYTFGAVAAPAAGFGAPHARHRIYWVAESLYSERGQVVQHRENGCDGANPGRPEAYGVAGACSEVRIVAESHQHQRRQERTLAIGRGEGSGAERLEQRFVHGGDGELADAEHPNRRAEFKADGDAHGRDGLGRCGDLGGMGDSKVNGHERQSLRADGESPLGVAQTSFWSDCEWLPCRDSKFRPTQPGLFPLSYGLPRHFSRMQPELRGYAEMAGLSPASLARAKGNRIGALRGAGNAIVPAVAAEFIKAYLYVKQTHKD